MYLDTGDVEVLDSQGRKLFGALDARHGAESLLALGRPLLPLLSKLLGRERLRPHKVGGYERNVEKRRPRLQRRVRVRKLRARPAA
jgi:hypothetical protein